MVTGVQTCALPIFDYYDNEYKNGDFSQYVYNSGWNTVINDMVAKRLTKIGATEHLTHFRKMVAVAESLPDEEMSTFLNSQYFGTNNLRDSLNDKGFYNIDEDIMLLNARWLRNHSNLRVLSIDDIVASHITTFISNAQKARSSVERW